MRHVGWIGLVSALGAVGCAAMPPHPPEIARADGVIRAAEASGARGDVSAAIYLDLAGEELRRARAQAASGDFVGAHAWAIRAEADAGIAAMMAREITARACAQRAWDDVAKLEEQLERPPVVPSVEGTRVGLVPEARR